MSPATTPATNGCRLKFEVHDQHQLELRFSFPLDGAERSPREFEVDTYFFVPRNVGVSETNYTPQQFYGDVTAHVRLDALPQPLSRLSDPHWPDSPLAPLRAACDQLSDRGSPTPSTEHLAVHAKLFAWLHTQAVRREVTPRGALRDDAMASEDEARREARRRSFDEDLLAALARIAGSLQALRRLREQLRPFDPVCHGSLAEALAWADEHMSLFVEERLAELTADIEDDLRLHDGTAFVARVVGRLRRLARDEATHRVRRGYLVSADGGTAREEYYTYRRSLLKKSVHEALYLDVRQVKKRDAFLKNMVGASGAALAAIWAWSSQMPMTVANLPTETKMLFFAAAVGGYVLKDRIKAFANGYVLKRLRRFDQVFRVHGAAFEAFGLGMLDAKLSESMRFRSADEIDEAVRDIRVEQRTVSGVGPGVGHEEVIHYRKQLRVERAEAEALPSGRGVLDILRLNVRHFLTRLDDAVERVQLFDGARDAFRERKLPKVYHMHVIVRMRSGGADAGGPVHDEHLRVILNKKGIVRVESVAAARS